MLVLKRKIGQKFRIGEAVVEILEITSVREVKVGIVAPKEVPVDREEIYQKNLDKSKKPDKIE